MDSNLLVLMAIVFNCSWLCSGFKLQILHMNDLHARFDEVDEYTASCTPTAASQGQCFGGFPRIRALADHMREEAHNKNISSIFLNAGDTFQGTPYYSVYKWKIAAALMNTLDFDAMCLGNHEFDDGVDNLVEYLKHVTTPTVTANLNRTSEKRLGENLVKNSIVLDVKGHKIGIVGYLTPVTTVLSKTENLQIFDEIPYLREEAKFLKSKGVNIIIGLGHSGFSRDKEIAKEVDEVDIIIGGHSHTLLYNPKGSPPSREKAEETYPYWVTQKSGKRVPIVQSSAFTKYFGILNVVFDDQYRITSAEGNSHLLDNKYKKDSSVEDKVQKWTATLRKKLRKVIGQTRVSLTKSTFNKNGFESNFANFVTDAFFHQGVLQTKTQNLSEWTKYATAFYPNGGIRAEFGGQRNNGNLTLEDIYTALPFQNKLYQCRLSGREIQQALEISLVQFNPTDRYCHHFIHFSGLRVIYDLRLPPSQRVTNVTVLCTQCPVPQYEKLEDSKTYSIILDFFLLRGGDGFTVFKNSCKDVKSLEIVESEAVVDYIQKQQIIYPILDGRLQVLEAEEASMAPRKICSTLYYLLLIIVIGIRAVS